MAIIYPLASSSKGNCIYVGNQQSGVLIDAGIGIRAFAAHLALIGIPPEAIKGIFVTHEHTDHVKGLERIQKALKVPVYGSKGTLKRLIEKKVLPPFAPMQLAEEETVLSGCSVIPFATPHDSEQSQCYRIRTAEGTSAVVCTDLGHMTDEIHRHLLGSDVVMLESNYEESMLCLLYTSRFLNEKQELARLLSNAFSGIKVIFGKENDTFSITNSSMVVSPYKIGEAPGGSLGIIGPLRLDYAKVIPYMQYFSESVTKLLSDILHEEEK